jgi:hypothetical protein
VSCGKTLTAASNALGPLIYHVIINGCLNKVLVAVFVLPSTPLHPSQHRYPSTTPASCGIPASVALTVCAPLKALQFLQHTTPGLTSEAVPQNLPQLTESLYAYAFE